ncbi:amino acid carrier protein [Isosphaera pallida ATCC 43644]|uniref:Amino acid carrier protein n=1 Tax=Isosphaera pallida (strain ATCC 43644 / DSM 9630 / IS1B) TaxID=575540 RepID=E8R1M6_ISOPI|nr:amino acid carrier protein [Isosphaera pallida]ADV63444.1 amino acid carrier protein [Isosphaera pallida ATCC 43644]
MHLPGFFDTAFSVYDAVLEWLVPILWSTVTFVTMLTLGIGFSIWSKFVQYRALTHGVRVTLGQYDEPDTPGALNHFQALTTALSGTIGLGNIGGVALAVGIGGPGALFWMWIVGLLGMAIKTLEVALAMMYRDESDPHHPKGGAMYVAWKGLPTFLGPAFKPLGTILGYLFCLALCVATFTGGNMFQSWNIGDITRTYYGVPTIYTGVALAVAVAVVILGGIRRIGQITEKLVPVMCLIYLLGGVAILIVGAANVPEMLGLIVRSAFSPSEGQGAFLGASVWFALTTGMKRAVFSNEAGQGSSPLAHSAVKTKEPIDEAVVAGIEPFIDTCLVCTLTGLVLLTTSAWNRPPDGDFTDQPVRIVDGRLIAPESIDTLQFRGEAAAMPLRANDQLFLVVEVAVEGSEGSSQRRKLYGTIVPSKTEQLKLGPVKPEELPFEIIWSAPEKGTTLVGLAEPGVYRDYKGAALTGMAFQRGLGPWAVHIVIVTCWFFAYSTLISWSYYGELAVRNLLGDWAIRPYQVVYCAAVVLPCVPGFITTDVELSRLADLGSGCMLFANLPILILMSPVAIKAIHTYFRRVDSGEIKRTH